MINHKYRFIDLFAGIGGMRLAFERAQNQCVFSSEWDRFAQETYFANFAEMPCGDITKIAATEIPKHDILAAGFPCQPFSSIGKREGFEHSTQGTLFFDIVRILAEKRPKAFLLENVQGLKNHDSGNTLSCNLRNITRRTRLLDRCYRFKCGEFWRTTTSQTDLYCWIFARD